MLAYREVIKSTFAPFLYIKKLKARQVIKLNQFYENTDLTSLISTLQKIDSLELFERFYKDNTDINHTSLLGLAFSSRSQEAILALLRLGACLSVEEEKEKSLLERVIELQDVQAVIALLRNQDCNVNVVNKEGNTPLMLVIIKFYDPEDTTSVVKLLIAAGADIHAANNHGYRALHHAAFYQRLGVTEALLAADKNREDVNAKDQNGDTPLSIAASLDVRIVDALVARGAVLPSTRS